MNREVCGPAHRLDVAILQDKTRCRLEKEQYLNDLKDIKEMMSRSSRFIYLSGLSGISVGILA